MPAFYCLYEIRNFFLNSIDYNIPHKRKVKVMEKLSIQKLNFLKSYYRRGIFLLLFFRVKILAGIRSVSSEHQESPVVELVETTEAVYHTIYIITITI